MFNKTYFAFKLKPSWVGKCTGKGTCAGGIELGWRLIIAAGILKSCLMARYDILFTDR